MCFGEVDVICICFVVFFRFVVVFVDEFCVVFVFFFRYLFDFAVAALDVVVDLMSLGKKKCKSVNVESLLEYDIWCM